MLREVKREMFSNQSREVAE